MNQDPADGHFHSSHDSDYHVMKKCLKFLDFKDARAIWHKVIRFWKYLSQTLFGQYLIDWSYFQLRFPFKI